jgi:hypothetical protein
MAASNRHLFRRHDISVNVYRDITKVIGSAWQECHQDEMAVYFMPEEIMFCTLDDSYIATLHSHRPNYSRVYDYLWKMANILENIRIQQRDLDRLFLKSVQAEKDKEPEETEASG